MYFHQVFHPGLATLLYLFTLDARLQSPGPGTLSHIHPTAGWMPEQRLRRWTGIKPAAGWWTCSSGSLLVSGWGGCQLRQPHVGSNSRWSHRAATHATTNSRQNRAAHASSPRCFGRATAGLGSPHPLRMTPGHKWPLDGLRACPPDVVTLSVRTITFQVDERLVKEKIYTDNNTTCPFCSSFILMLISEKTRLIQYY